MANMWIMYRVMTNKTRYLTGQMPNRRNVMANAVAKTANHGKKHAVAKVPHNKSGVGVFGKIGRFFRNTRLEMKKWSCYTKKDLLKYSLIVIFGLLLVGVAVWAVDTGASYALMKFASLRP